LFVKQLPLKGISCNLPTVLVFEYLIISPIEKYNFTSSIKVSSKLKQV
jgi:hypothetical protein